MNVKNTRVDIILQREDKRISEEFDRLIHIQKDDDYWMRRLLKGLGSISYYLTSINLLRKKINNRWAVAST